MAQYKILIVEDERITALRIRATLEKAGYAVTCVAPTGELALESIRNEIPDLVLMDIGLDGGLDGITTAKSINRGHTIPIIFMTKFKGDEIFNHAKEAFPQSYISKPFTDSSLLRAIELAIQNTNYRLQSTRDINIPQGADYIFIPTTNGNRSKVSLKDIIYIEAVGAYSRIHFDAATSDLGRFMDVSVNTGQLVKQLNYVPIVRIHRSYHVNIDKVNKLNKNSIFIGDIELPIGAEFSDDLFKNRIRSIIYKTNKSKKNNKEQQ